MNLISSLWAYSELVWSAREPWRCNTGCSFDIHSYFTVLRSSKPLGVSASHSECDNLSVRGRTQIFCQPTGRTTGRTCFCHVLPEPAAGGLFYYYYYRLANSKPSGHRAHTQRVCSHTMGPLTYSAAQYNPTNIYYKQVTRHNHCKPLDI